METKIAARVLLDSMCYSRLTTLALTMPRILLAEFNTHRMLSRNCASSRAIPVEKRCAAIRAQPYAPIVFGANQRGMQAGEAMDQEKAAEALRIWNEASESACSFAEKLAAVGLHKQWANRLNENFSYVTDLATFTEEANFFNLRVSKDAQDEFDELSGLAHEAMMQSEPTQIKVGDWHIPYGDRMPGYLFTQDQLKVSVARCARVSYETQDGKIDPEADMALYQRLLSSGHMSPFEHQAQAVHPHQEPWRRWCVSDGKVSELSKILKETNSLWDGSDLWWGNLRWWKQYRKTIPGENRTVIDNIQLHNEWLERRKARGTI